MRWRGGRSSELAPSARPTQPSAAIVVDVEVEVDVVVELVVGARVVAGGWVGEEAGMAVVGADALGAVPAQPAATATRAATQTRRIVGRDVIECPFTVSIVGCSRWPARTLRVSAGWEATVCPTRSVEPGVSSMELRGKNVVITGGSGGIGAGLAAAFAERGAHVLVAARSLDKLKAVADPIVGDHLVVDLTDAEQVDGFVQACLDKLGHIDVFVNNAGVETSTSFATTDRDGLRTVARLNFEAPLLLTRDVLPTMLARGSGHVVQLSSVAGAIPFPGLAAYAGTKAGLTNFTETLRLELKGTGIGLTVVSPGPVQTDMWARLENQDRPFAGAALTRFKQLGFLPKLSVDKVVAATVAAVEKDKRFVRIPKRYGMYYSLNNAPRRLVEGALLGVRFPQDWKEQQ